MRSRAELKGLLKLGKRISTTPEDYKQSIRHDLNILCDDEDAGVGRAAREELDRLDKEFNYERPEKKNRKGGGFGKK